MRSRQSARDTLAGVRLSRGLPAHPASLPEWSFRVAGLRITLPNFSWRRGAIDKHDLHHLVLDEPFNLKGECQVATWEFAAGAYPDVRAQLFCLPLVALGAATAPMRTWQSYASGRRSDSLYQTALDPALSIEELKTLTMEKRLCAPARVKSGFARLLAASASLYLAPLALVGVIIAASLF